MKESRVFLQSLILTLVIIVSAQAKAEDLSCEPSTYEFTNKDKSIVKLITHDCGQDLVPITVMLKRNKKSEWEQIFTESIERFVSAAFGAGLKDIDKDGFADIEIIRDCGIVNCTLDAYRFDPTTKSYYLYYKGGSNYEIRDGYMISWGRANCCSYTYVFNKILKRPREMVKDEPEFLMDIGTIDLETSKEYEVPVCKFFKQKRNVESLVDENVVIKPPVNGFDRYCGHYGGKYRLMVK